MPKRAVSFDFARLAVWTLALSLAAASSAAASDVPAKKRMVMRPLGQARAKSMTSSAAPRPVTVRVPVSSSNAAPSEPIPASPVAPVSKSAPPPVSTEAHKPAVTVIVNPVTGEVKKEF